VTFPLEHDRSGFVTIARLARLSLVATMNRIRNAFHVGILSAAVALVGTRAFADSGALGFVQKEHDTLSNLLRQPPSASRDQQIDAEIGKMVDFNQLAMRSFGQPCPASLPSCTNHWATLTPTQRAEVTPLLQKLIVKTERKNITKTLDYDVTYKGEQHRSGDTWLVQLEARSKANPREAVLEIAYLVQPQHGAFRVVDMITERSSRAGNYYAQFNRMLTTEDQGYPYLLAKLKENVAKKSTVPTT
jgi:ABC-type transporter MlaC component